MQEKESGGLVISSKIQPLRDVKSRHWKITIWQRKKRTPGIWKKLTGKIRSDREVGRVVHNAEKGTKQSGLSLACREGIWTLRSKLSTQN